ncbi:alternate signal-mediated exported protein, RER_14450 family [Microbacterium hydrothermale]|uniref:alternate-type signal peptide domain-containing protein n=1 Tax=Microbacterium hydrothermale TaxID=857427 RepID=UPI002225C4CF|nr:alternate-type signal peptide domain-containing protein [Microbacterium hydrothermale]MCW2164672.1 alternate signal-mediated exported protein, RER_14450 family [Microbacterium hydrothermale]
MSLETAPATRASLAQRPVRRHRRTTAIAIITVGAALLSVGGGSYAYWSTQTALTAGPVTAGDLNLSLGAGTWTLKGVLGTAQPVANLTTVKIVPGDVLTLTQPIDVTLVGNTIAADLKAEVGSTFTSGALGSNLDVVLSVASYGTATSANTYRLSSANSGAATATLTVTFKPGTIGRAGATQSVNLNDIAFTLTQASS